MLDILPPELQPTAGNPNDRRVALREKPSDRRMATRYAYAATHQLATCDENGVPPDESFIDIKCRDLSETGISFFAPSPPSSKNLVIRVSIGNERHLMWVQAVHYRSITDACGPTYLVGCRFVAGPSAPQTDDRC